MRHPREIPTHSGGLLTSAELAHARADASAAALVVRQNTGSRYVGFVRRRRVASPSQDGSAIVYDTGEVKPFASESEMWRWLREVTSYPRGYDFAALFDAENSTWPNPITEDAPGLS